MTVKEAIHQLVDALSDEEAEALLDYLNMLADPDELTEEELAEVQLADEEFARGEYITREELLAKYPL